MQQRRPDPAGPGGGLTQPWRQAQCTLFMSGTLTLSLVGPFMVSVQLTGG